MKKNFGLLVLLFLFSCMDSDNAETGNFCIPAKTILIYYKATAPDTLYGNWVCVSLDSKGTLWNTIPPKSGWHTRKRDILAAGVTHFKIIN